MWCKHVCGSVSQHFQWPLKYDHYGLWTLSPSMYTHFTAPVHPITDLLHLTTEYPLFKDFTFPCLFAKYAQWVLFSNCSEPFWSLPWFPCFWLHICAWFLLSPQSLIFFLWFANHCLFTTLIIAYCFGSDCPAASLNSLLHLYPSAACFHDRYTEHLPVVCCCCCFFVSLFIYLFLLRNSKFLGYFL